MRFLHTILREFYTQKKTLTIYAITAFTTLFIVQTIPVVFVRLFGGTMPLSSSYNGLFVLFLFIGGALYTSNLFHVDMFGKGSNQAWMMLPASSVEKFFSKALMTLLYPFALIIFFMVASLFTEGVLALLFHKNFVPFLPFNDTVWVMTAHALVVESVFLLGATFFRKSHFAKTVLTVSLISIVLGIIATITVYLLFVGLLSHQGEVFARQVEYNLAGLEDVALIQFFMKSLYWVVLPVFCWIVSYLRVEEVQFTDAVR